MLIRIEDKMIKKFNNKSNKYKNKNKNKNRNKMKIPEIASLK